MSLAFLFWLIMILWLLFSLWWGGRGPTGAWSFGPAVGGSFILWILLFMLGWRVFGFPIHP